MVWLDSLLRVAQGWNQGVRQFAFPSGASSPLWSLGGYWHNSVSCVCRTKISPHSCWLSARGQLLEATCHFLPCGSLHNMAVCPSKANRAFESLTSCLWPLDSFKKTDLIRSGPPTFKGKELYIYRLYTQGSTIHGGHSAYHRGMCCAESFCWRREEVLISRLALEVAWKHSCCKYLMEPHYMPDARDGATSKADGIPALLELTVQRPLEKFHCHFVTDYGDGCTTLCKH